jgi:hypothetical protein
MHILRAPLLIAARLACNLHGFLRQQAAALKIQKNIRCYFARTTYSQLCLSVITLQTGLRAMAARNEFNSRKENKASIHIQVGQLFWHVLQCCFPTSCHCKIPLQLLISGSSL